MNELVRSGAVKAPVVIGRDHLDAGSVASPYRETEAMRDGSDAIADWPILNALVNVAAGATWVSVHHGGGVGIGNAIHAGMVVVADGTDAAAERLGRVLTTDPGTGVMRHADAGYPEAIEAAEQGGLRLPSPPGPRVTAARAAAARPRPRAGRDRRRGVRRRCAGRRSARSTSLEDALRPLCRRTRSRRWGGCATCPRSTATSSSWTGVAAARSRASSTATRMPRSAATASRSSRSGPRARATRSCTRAGGGILATVRATRAAGEDGLRDAVERHRGWMLRHGTTTFEAKSGYGLDRETELASLRGDPRRRRRPDVARRARRPARVRRRRRRVPRLRARGRASRGGAARRGGRRLPRAGRLRRGAGAPLPRGVPRGRARAAPARRPVHRGRARSRSRSSSAPARSTTSRRPAPTASRTLAASDVVGVLLPASALFLGRPMPPGARARRRGRRRRPRDRLQPGQRLLREPAALLLARRDPAEALAGGGARRLHRQRRPRARPRRPRSAGSRPATGPTSSSSTRPTGATSPTTSAATSSRGVVLARRSSRR